MAESTSAVLPGAPAIPMDKVDLPDLRETFADAIENVVFDGQSMRIEFCVTRLEQREKAAPRAKRYPACRLVLTPNAAVELMKQMRHLASGLANAGVVKQPAVSRPEVEPKTK